MKDLKENKGFRFWVWCCIFMCNLSLIVLWISILYLQFSGYLFEFMAIFRNVMQTLITVTLTYCSWKWLQCTR